MTFDTIEFWIFLPLLLLAFYIVPIKTRKYVLLLGNLFFYISLDWKVLCLAVATVIITFYSGIQIENYKENQPKKAKVYTVGTIVFLVLVLALFKYLNFFADTIHQVLNWFHIQQETVVFELLAMVGLSYYSLKAVSYLMEVYGGNRKAVRDFVVYADYLLFFPQIVAGPIQEPDSFIGQLEKGKIPDERLKKQAILLLATGYMKKLVIANMIVGYVDTVYGNIAAQNGLSCIFAAFLYSMQIYCDFSGYSDISIGVTALFGIKVEKNFNCPYLAVNVQDFWRRWHISLSSFLRKYIYISLGGNRKGKLRKIGNTLITFLVSGLWHGASWTFVFWGFYHGVGNCLGQKKQRQEENQVTLIKAGKILVTFIFVTIGWVFFRADSFQNAFLMLKKMVMEFSLSIGAIEQTILVFTGDMMSLCYFLVSLVMIGILMVREFRYTYGDLKKENLKKCEKEELIWIAFCVFTIICFGDFGTKGFIYANF